VAVTGEAVVSALQQLLLCNSIRRSNSSSIAASYYHAPSDASEWQGFANYIDKLKTTIINLKWQSIGGNQWQRQAAISEQQWNHEQKDTGFHGIMTAVSM